MKPKESTICKCKAHKKGHKDIRKGTVVAEEVAKKAAANALTNHGHAQS